VHVEQPLPTVLVSGPPGPPPPPGWQGFPRPGPLPPTGFDVGTFLSRSFGTWWRNLFLFAPIGLVTQAPVAAAVYLLYSRMPELMRPMAEPSFDRVFRYFGAFAVIWVMTMVAMIVQLGAVAHGALHRLRGERAGFGDMLAAGIRRSPTVFVVGLLAWLAMIPALCTCVGPIFLSVAWAASVPAVMAERLGPVRALGRSWDLTRGFRWQVFAGFLVIYAALFAVQAVVQGAAMGVGFATGALFRGEPGAAMAAPMAISQLTAGVMQTLMLVGCSAAYHGLRLAKEGDDPARLATIFE
jgi:hypothetical protein